MDQFDEAGPLAALTAMLTAVARQRGSDGHAIDFAEVLACALASAAANVGGVAQLVAGRSGSWEASLVEALVDGTVPDEPEELIRFRTEPIRVPLNVAELAEDDCGLPGLWRVMEDVDRLHFDTDDHDADAYERESKELEERFIAAYANYARQFERAVATQAARFEGCNVPVVVEADIDPNSAWWRGDAIRNPTASDVNVFVSNLWNKAIAVVGPPTVPTRQDGAAVK